MVVSSKLDVHLYRVAVINTMLKMKVDLRYFTGTKFEVNNIVLRYKNDLLRQLTSIYHQSDMTHGEFYFRRKVISKLMDKYI